MKASFTGKTNKQTFNSIDYFCSFMYTNWPADKSKNISLLLVLGITYAYMCHSCCILILNQSSIKYVEKFGCNTRDCIAAKTIQEIFSAGVVCM